MFGRDYNLYVSGQLPENFALVSIGRRDKTEDSFRREAAESIGRYTRENSGTRQDIDRIVSRFYYRRADFTAYDGYQEIKDYLDTLDGRYRTVGNRVFYLAVAPEHFGTIVRSISRSGMSDQGAGYKRVVIEKPFGQDLRSASEPVSFMRTRSTGSTIFSARRCCRISW